MRPRLRRRRPAPNAGLRTPAPAVENRPPAPPHVSEEPEPVATVADPGAEAGAGAQLEIAEPWEGYDRMPVSQVTQQLAVAPVEAAAAVRLYEAANRREATSWTRPKPDCGEAESWVWG